MGRVIYRPAGMFYSLDEAMEKAKIFDSVEDMKKYLVEIHQIKWVYLFDYDDIVINKDGFDDNRIGWKDVHYVCVKRFYDKIYDVPQCIGYCAYKWS
jgi:hypothetical protein